MKAMQDMHQRMQAAKTPAERMALMDEHMKLMQSGMTMMGQMRGMGAMAGPGAMGGPGNPGSMGMMPPQSPGAGADQGAPGMRGMAGMMGMHQQMERRMALMEQMMQMMVDREAAMQAFGDLLELRWPEAAGVFVRRPGSDRFWLLPAAQEWPEMLTAHSVRHDDESCSQLVEPADVCGLRLLDATYWPISNGSPYKLVEGN